jgi:diguanylate cyclase (GGDEF)-like protein
MDDSRRKILIVDDVPANIMVMNEILKNEYEVFFARSGADALEISFSEKPDLILLDIMMPGMDGYEVCGRLKADPQTKGIPVIFVTAMGEVADETRGLEIGAIDYIIKPVSPPIVRARVKNHIELKKYRDILENLSLIDGLTGIANRRHFDEVFDREWRRALRFTNPLSMIMIDIDFFKDYNDCYGHLEGDECLRTIARIIKESVNRGGDTVARYGGEEFSVLLPMTGAEKAFYLAEKVRENIEKMRIPNFRSEINGYVTVSVGVATDIPQRNTSPSTLIDNADKALYLAKNGGRNRVVRV